MVPGEVLPGSDPAGGNVPGVVVVPVCGAALYAIMTRDTSDAVGPLPEVEQWSAIFVTLLTWNEFVPAAVEVLFPVPMLPAVPVRLLVAPAWSLGLLAPVAELEAELPFGEAFAEALAPPIGCPVISTCSPTCVRRASVLPVSV